MQYEFYLYRTREGGLRKWREKKWRGCVLEQLFSSAAHKQRNRNSSAVH